LGSNSGWKSLSENEAITLVKKSIDYGINFFDTAPNYGLGTSEERLGKALKGIDRDKIVINTKFGHSASGKSNYSSNYIRESLEGSLRRLQVNYVDSIIMHNPPFEFLDGNATDHYEIFERLIDEGKIRAYGASLDTFKEMKRFMDTTNGEVIEAFFNILHQDASRAFEMAKQKGVGIIAKIPLDSGWLSGKYNAESTFNDVRSRWSKDDIKTRASLIENLKKIIGEGHQLSQTAIGFCLSYDAVSTVIPGNTSLDQLKNNIKSIEHPLAKDLVEKLEYFYQSEVKQLRLPW
jgi:aryl-alcohol dehydrogenase-like predicted oxidoreductase